MAKKRYKNLTPIGSTLDKKIYEELIEYSKKTNIPMSRILDMAIKEYIEKNTNK